jgi:class 3 adenylate cyclase
VPLEGASALPFLGDADARFRGLDEFPSGSEEPVVAPAEPPASGAFRTVSFTDVEGSTSMVQRLGDAKGRAVLREHERIVRHALRTHRGSEVTTMGDSFIASFSSATEALQYAILMQRAFAEHNETAEEPTRVRIGLNTGEPVAEGEDLFGKAVVLAARVAAEAEGGRFSPRMLRGN